MKAFNINTPPGGAWIRKDFDDAIIGASTRHIGAFVLVPVGIFFSVLVIGIINEALDVGSSLIPLAVAGLFSIVITFFWIITLMLIFGKVEIKATDTGGKIFTGISKLGITQKFEWDEVSDIVISKEYIHSSSSRHGEFGSGSRIQISIKILIASRGEISFGSMLNEKRRLYILEALKSIMLEKQKLKYQKLVSRRKPS